ncbi:MAG: NAD(P)H-dependent oxidoreductase subunit E [Clostridiales Family XIII bacterium]|nr:NAD(P)H-dependent oxidoreductase subunit E [Clostridiales Family XIII bacterium]
MNRVSSVPFEGTKEQESELRDWLEEHKEVRGIAMNALQKAQEIYGYLPVEVQKMISEEIDVPLAEIYGIATFYAQFALSPKGKHKIQVCLGTACYVKGNGDIFEKIENKLGIKDGERTADGKFSLDSCRCIGACGLAPVLVIGDDVYGRLSGKDSEIDEILAKY